MPFDIHWSSAMAMESDGTRSTDGDIKSSIDIDLFHSLISYPEKVPLSVLHAWIEAVGIGPIEVKRYVHFDVDRYQRNLMFSGPSFQVLVLCWRNGQRSPIHDHVGSNCAVKVIRGIATETVFAQAQNGMIYATGSRTLGEGATCASADQDIHQISNLQADAADLITLHIYSPPLLAMNAYSLVDAKISQFFDPINERFVGGAGI
jgi:cysteine dioxygenase